MKFLFPTDRMIQKHSSLFGDMLSFTIAYLDNLSSLNLCMAAFLRENPDFGEVATKYLEPMGSALILTLRQWLGNGVFTRELQAAWIKIYIYFANYVLDFDQVEAFVESEDEPIQALNPRRSISNDIIPQRLRPFEVRDELKDEDIPEPDSRDDGLNPDAEVYLEGDLRRTTDTEDEQREQQYSGQESPVCSEDPESVKLQVDINHNEKYRGFRRNAAVGERDNGPILINVPSNAHFKEIDDILPQVMSIDPMKMRQLSSPSIPSEEDHMGSQFDPRWSAKSKGSHKEQLQYPEVSCTTSQIDLLDHRDKEDESYDCSGDITNKKPRISRIAERRMKIEKLTKVNDDINDDFGPRKKEFGFDPRSLKQALRPQNATSETSATEEDEEIMSEENMNFGEKCLQDNSQIKSRSPIFDASSFGLSGLATITETDFNDTSSSKYGSDEEAEQNDTQSLYFGSSSCGELDDVSSGASALSLHNSDYRSSINTDYTSASPALSSHKKLTSRQPSTSSDISILKMSPVTNLDMERENLQSRSMSMTSAQFRQRASLGFMRSSFVLKKEIDRLGLNEQAEVHQKSHLCSSNATYSSKLATQSSDTIGSCASSTDGCMDLLNTFGLMQEPKRVGPKFGYMQALSRSGQSTSDLASNFSLSSLRRSLKHRISSIFSKKRGSLGASTLLTSDLTSLNSEQSVKTTFSGFSFLSKKKNLSKSSYAPSTDERNNKYSFAAVSYDTFSKT